MDSVTLNIFATVAAELSITRAAAQLGRVQSNVTTRIQNLEQELGTELFHRDGKKLRLTEQGKVFLQYTLRMLALANEAQQAMRPDIAQGTLRIGSMESTAASRLPAPLCRFHQQSSLVTIRVTTGPSLQLAEWLERGEIDCALLAPPREAESVQTDFLEPYGFKGEPAFEETLRLVLPKGYTEDDVSARNPPLALAAFKAGCTYRHVASQWLSTQRELAGSALVVNEVGSYHAMLACVASGQSFSVIPQSVLQMGADLSSVELRASIPSTTWLVWRADYSTAAFEAFKDVLRVSYSPQYTH